MTEDPREVAGGDGPVGEPEPAFRGGGFPLPGLKYWRLRRGISQAELSRRADLGSDYVFKVESGRRGCNPETARLLADLLEIDLQDLRRKPVDALDREAFSEPSRSKVIYRHVHQEYLRIMLALPRFRCSKTASGGSQDALTQQIKARPSVHLALDEL